VSKPPPLPWAVRSAPERFILICSLGALVLAGAWALMASVLPFGWPCVWKAVTGWPCAGCGGTRSLLFLVNGNWLAALQLNPGVVMAGGLLLIANLYAVAVLIFRIEPWRPTVRRWRWALGCAVAANWLYLVAVSRP
jgi:hypothetical protein